MSKKTYLINFISGPSSGKSCMAALVFAKLKIKGYIAEYVQEYAKILVWTKDFDTLNNQYYVTKKQYELFKEISGNVDFIVTDGTILHGLYYNRHNKDNISNIEKTEKLILEKNNEFNNINIFLDRGNIKYETQGRIQTEDEAKEIDIILKHMLKQNGISYKIFLSDIKTVDEIVDYIISCTKE